MAGLDAEVLDQVYDKCIELTDGAEHLIATLKQHGWKARLVSGDFIWFTDKLETRLYLDFTLSNVLWRFRMSHSPEASLATLWMYRQKRSTALAGGGVEYPREVRRWLSAMVSMIFTAGLGIAFHAKPKVVAQVACAIDTGGLDGILELLH